MSPSVITEQLPIAPPYNPVSSSVFLQQNDKKLVMNSTESNINVLKKELFAHVTSHHIQSNPSAKGFTFNNDILLNNPTCWVGISSYANQLHRYCSRTGFTLNLLVVGESGCGKSTLMKSLFPLAENNHSTSSQAKNLGQDATIDSASDFQNASLKFTDYSQHIHEFDVSLNINITMVEGHGDFVDNSNLIPTLVEKIQKGFEDHCNVESDLFRRFKGEAIDNRYHACIYVIPPWVSRLRKIDILAMSKLEKIVNLIPVIGRAEILTLRELSQLKAKLLGDISRFDIKIFYPSFDNRDEEFVVSEISRLQKSIPFAVIGIAPPHELSQSGHETSDYSKCREYPWGKINLESDEYYDFLKFKQLLISDHCVELRELTADRYERYRAEVLAKRVGSQPKKGDLMQLKMHKEEMKERLAKYEEKLKIDQNRQITLLINSTENQYEKEIASLKKREQEMQAELEAVLNQVSMTKDKILSIEKEKLKSEKEARAVATLSASIISAHFDSNSSSFSMDNSVVDGSKKKTHRKKSSY